MGNMKHSQQRDAILQELCTRKDHPTADDLYTKLKEDMPAISLGTVYRNLAVLADNGSILKLSFGGADHYDGDTSVHYHFVCDACKQVTDLDFPPLAGINSTVEEKYECTVHAHTLTFFGVCKSCVEKK